MAVSMVIAPTYLTQHGVCCTIADRTLYLEAHNKLCLYMPTTASSGRIVLAWLKAIGCELHEHMVHQRLAVT